ncbi:aspartate kinase [Fulvivirga sedimenti]|uniref:Aspartokinase n=1 Tax=Fulvivirga sedimenti TaxID=2879465 RepID=A0A9X1HV05_9BACT|nr:aspartate kinase [Fulvivirga sedimenti]MCA6078176.1 aspartate kinase [Fulvivirga sedimenti]
MVIYKFGGTSVGAPERMQKVARLITADNEPKIVVLSAVSGTTNKLVEIGNALLEVRKSVAREAIARLREEYDTFADGLFSTEDGKKEGVTILNNFFEDLTALAGIPDFNEGNNKTLLAIGELMSTHLFNAFLKERNIKSVLLPALNFMSIDRNGEPEIPRISEKLNAMLANYPEDILFVTQGFICRNSNGQTDNLQRGGSDYTASLIGAAIKAREVQIWTDIDGMHNNDPRIVENTKPISALTFDEAAELAYFGAKILHPSSIQPAQKFGIPVWLKSTLDETAYGTLIGEPTDEVKIKAIAAKDNITAIKIKSSRMLLAHGFLRKVFEIFEKYATSIDMITTSEVAVSLTIDNTSHMDKIIHELETFGQVAVDPNMSIICIVGHMISEKKGVIRQVFDALDDIPIRMVSIGGSKNNISILVETRVKNDALKALNKGLF